MPYSDLDLNYTEKHNSAWVTLPNSYYDPAKGHLLYNPTWTNSNMRTNWALTAFALTSITRMLTGSCPFPA